MEFLTEGHWDGAGTGTFQDVKSGYFKGLQFFLANGTLTANPSLAASAVFTEWTGETWTFEIYTEAPGTILGRPLRFADRNGNAIVHTWKYAVTDPALSGSLRSKLRIRDAITDAYGRSARFTYDESTQQSGQWVTTRIDLPNGQHLDYAYGDQVSTFGNFQGKLSRVAHPDGTVSTFSTRVDPALNCIVWSVSDPVAEPQSRFKQVWFSSAIWVDSANPANQVSQIFGRVRQIVDGNGDITFQGGIQDFPDGLGGTESRTYYYTQNKLFAVVHQGGDRPTATYERNALPDGQPFFNPTADWSGWTKTFSITPGPASLTAAAFTDANGNTQQRTIDPATDSVLGEAYPDGSTSITERNGFQQITRAVDRVGRVTLTTFDAQGNRLSETRGAGTPDAGTWTWTYWTAADSAIAGHGRPGQIRTATDARSNVTNYVYYPSGDLAQVIEPADVVGAPRATTTYVVDAAGRCTSVTDPANRLTQFGYDGLNRQVSALYADGSTELWTYPTTGLDAGLLAAYTDRNGHVTVYAHDGFGHTVATTRAAGTSVAVTDYTTFVPGNITTPNGQVNAGNAVTFQFDLRMRKVAEIRNTRGGNALTTRFSYDDANLLRSSTDPYGRRTLHVFDVNDRIVRVVRELIPGGVPAAADLVTLPRIASANPPYVIEDTAYDASGLVTARIDGRGNRTEQVYDGQGRPVIAREAVGTADLATVTTSYDAQGNVVDVTDARGFHTTATYSGRNLRLRQVEAAGTAVAAATTWTYTPTKKLATATDALLRTTINTYGVCCDRLVAIQDPAGFITTMGYDFYGNRTSVTDANGLPTVTTYDARNRPSSVTNAANETIVLTYTDNASVLPEAAGLGLGTGAVGSSVATTNALGERNLEIRDGLGRTIRRVDGLGKATTVVYDTLVTDSGATLVATTSTDPLAHATVSLADGAGRTRVVIDPVAARTEHGFDPAGNKLTTKRILPGSAPAVLWTCSYDARNRDVACTTPGAAPQAKTYDANSNLLTVSDGLGGVTVSTYDARNRKLTTTDRINATTTFTYDAVSNLLTILDQDNTTKGAAGNPTVYTYESRNLLATETFPTGQKGRTVRSYRYDGGRRLTRRTVTTAPASAFSEVTNYDYDRANRLITRSYPDAKNDVFAYDTVSRLTSATSNRYATRVTRTYDSASRLTAETLTYTAGVDMGIPLVIDYGYDQDDRLTTLTYPDGSVITRSYTNRNELRQIWDAGQSQQVRTYDAAGRLTSSLFGNNRTETRTYVPGDVLVASIVTPATSGAPISSFTYTYDANKRKLTELDGAQTSVSQRFSYDSQDRLTNWKQGTGVAPADPASTAQTWTLSPVGDWNSLATTTASGTTTQPRTHSNVHELLTVGTTALTYDAKGNLTKDDQGQLFAWDVENRLLSATALKQSQGVSATYAYDALGRRVRKETKASSTATAVPTTFVSAGAQEVIEITGDLSVAPWLPAGADADSETAGAAPYNPATGIGARGSLLSDPAAIRYNFQPTATDTPDGWLRDTGALRATATSRGWTVAQTGVDRAQLGRPLYDSFVPVSTATWQIPVANGTHAVVIMCGDAASRAQTNNLTVNGVSIVDASPYDGLVTNGYETGSFDGYARTVTVTNGLLTISAGAGALNAKVNFIEIGAVGSAVDAATTARVTAAAAQATQDTAKARAKTPPTVKRNVWGNYVDELVSYTVKKPRKSPTRYYTHSNSLFSIAATTNASGQVVEKYSYNAYGVQTVRNSANAVISKSSVGQDRGFTSYKLDSETSLIFAKTRHYSALSGRFINRNPWNRNAIHPAFSLLNILDRNDQLSESFAMAVSQSVGAYIQGRYSLYDFAGNNPSNYVEPYSVFCLPFVAGPTLTVAGEWVLGGIVAGIATWIATDVYETTTTTTCTGCPTSISTSTTTTTVTKTRQGGCPPCPPPPPPGQRLDRVPPSRPHFPCPGDHINRWHYEVNQTPWPDCKCFNNVVKDPPICL